MRLDDIQSGVYTRAMALSNGNFPLGEAGGGARRDEFAAIAEAYPGTIVVPPLATFATITEQPVADVDGRPAGVVVYDLWTAEPCDTTLRMTVLFKSDKDGDRYAFISGVEVVDQPSPTTAGMPKEPEPEVPIRSWPAGLSTTKPVYGRRNRIPDKYLPALRILLDDLVAGKYPDLMSEIDHYPDKLVRQPDLIFMCAELLKRRDSLEMVLPLFTERQSPSDLSAEIEIGADGVPRFMTFPHVM